MAVEKARLPVGGASYWQVLPTQLVLKGLNEAGPLAGLYLHPERARPGAVAGTAPK